VTSLMNDLICLSVSCYVTLIHKPGMYVHSKRKKRVGCAKNKQKSYFSWYLIDSGFLRTWIHDRLCCISGARQVQEGWTPSRGWGRGQNGSAHRAVSRDPFFVEVLVSCVMTCWYGMRRIPVDLDMLARFFVGVLDVIF